MQDLAQRNPFHEKLYKQLIVGSKTYHYYSLPSLNDPRIETLPISIRVLLEACIRNCDDLEIRKKDVETILDWKKTRNQYEIPFKTARVLLQDFTGIPAVVDLAAMRDAMKRLGGDAEKINPLIPVELVIDHSVQVDFARREDAVEKNQELEFSRNQERFRFLKWGAKSFKNLLIVPPGSGIVHQVNLEYLARTVFINESLDNLLYPDTVLGTDSHTTMINGLGVCGWGVGGIEAEAAMLGQSLSMVLPDVVGYKLTGKIQPHVTSTDIVLTITQNLRKHGVVSKFVEFFGPGVAELSIADRATLSNMAPEYGATIGFFPVDHVSLHYLQQTGREEQNIKVIEEYLKAQGLFIEYKEPSKIEYSSVLELDLGTVDACVAGPKRPQDRVSVSQMKSDFNSCLTNKISFKGYGISPEKRTTKSTFAFQGKEYSLSHGSVVIAAITSCTNTSNPSVMIGAGLLAKKAIELGLNVLPYIKTSLSPGSGVVTRYLTESGLIKYLTQLGFALVGYGCMTCIGNSGDLPEEVAEAINRDDIVAAGVLSGNRNFEGRIHPHLRANYLASPPLVVAYALAGRVDIDFQTEPLGVSSEGKPVYLSDIWPSNSEIQKLIGAFIVRSMFKEVYNNINNGTGHWNSLVAPSGTHYSWDDHSTYIHNPPFFQSMELEPHAITDIKGAYVLLNLGDFITTDHISPAGRISSSSPAARYLKDRGVSVADFNTYGARRGNDEVMSRGTFANSQLINKIMGKAAAKTLHIPSNHTLDIFDAAARYQEENAPVIILAGAEYGSGSSRDWAAKGPYLLGVKAVIAVSYERIHRSNLVGMGIIPLQFQPGDNADSLGLSHTDRFDIHIPSDLVPGQELTVKTHSGKSFKVLLRFDTEVELTYFKHGGILQYVLRRLLKHSK